MLNAHLAPFGLSHWLAHPGAKISFALVCVFIFRDFELACVHADQIYHQLLENRTLTSEQVSSTHQSASQTTRKCKGYRLSSTGFRSINYLGSWDSRHFPTSPGPALPGLSPKPMKTLLAHTPPLPSGISCPASIPAASHSITHVMVIKYWSVSHDSQNTLNFLHWKKVSW